MLYVTFVPIIEYSALALVFRLCVFSRPLFREQTKPVMVLMIVFEGKTELLEFY
jgi:hypothetical protein